jgi:hypothetical protein
MVTPLITEKRFHIRNWMWKQRLERSQSAHAGLIGDTRQLHFIFGVAGGGVDHLARLIAHPGSRLRFYNNLLTRFEPRLMFVGGGDRLALEYTKSLPRDHPLLRVYRMLVEYDNEWAKQRMNYRLGSENIETLPCLIKEDRGLLAIEAVLRELGSRALLYVSDPVKMIDRLFTERGEDVAYLRTEGRSLLSPYFLARFLRRDYSQVMHTHRHIQRIESARERRILDRVLNAALVQHMFRILAVRYPDQATLVEYDHIERDPSLLGGMLERLFGESGLVLSRSALTHATFHPHGKTKAIWKDAWPEKVASHGFLTEAERRLCYRMLQESGLTSSPSFTAKQCPLASAQGV